MHGLSEHVCMCWRSLIKTGIYNVEVLQAERHICHTSQLKKCTDEDPIIYIDGEHQKLIKERLFKQNKSAPVEKVIKVVVGTEK